MYNIQQINNNNLLKNVIKTQSKRGMKRNLWFLRQNKLQKRKSGGKNLGRELFLRFLHLGTQKFRYLKARSNLFHHKSLKLQLSQNRQTQHIKRQILVSGDLFLPCQLRNHAFLLLFQLPSEGQWGSQCVRLVIRWKFLLYHPWLCFVPPKPSNFEFGGHRESKNKCMNNHIEPRRGGKREILGDFLLQALLRVKKGEVGIAGSEGAERGEGDGFDVAGEGGSPNKSVARDRAFRFLGRGDFA